MCCELLAGICDDWRTLIHMNLLQHAGKSANFATDPGCQGNLKSRTYSRYHQNTAGCREVLDTYSDQLDPVGRALFGLTMRTPEPGLVKTFNFWKAQHYEVGAGRAMACAGRYVVV